MSTIGILAGDGVGPEVTRQALAVLGDVAAAHGLALDYAEFDLGADRLLRTGEVLPESAQAELSRCDAILLGAVGDPRVAPGVLEKGLLLKLRFDFHQHVNLRPVRLYEGVEAPIKGKGPAEVDMVVVRENNEDLYVGAGGFHRKGTPEEVAIQTSINTRSGVDRCLRFAFRQAEARREAGGRGTVTMVAKTNVLTFAHDLWMRAFDAMAGEFPDVSAKYMHVDACAMRMVTNPEWFDVIATTNMFGDILTDLGAVLQGGMGLAASANLNPEKTAPSMFEPVHGSAPDIAGKGIANPVAAILSAAMMLDHLGEAGAAGAIRSAVAAVLKAGEHRTPDLGGRSSTADVGRAVRDALGG